MGNDSWNRKLCCDERKKYRLTSKLQRNWSLENLSGSLCCYLNGSLGGGVECRRWT